MSRRAAIYARYSTAQQRASSIEDQVRRCTEIASRAGYELLPELIFADAAVTGSGDGIARRVEYHAMQRAWEARAFDALVVDELSRLARDAVEIAKLAERVEKSGVRFLTVDGIDSTQPHWQLTVGITGALAAHELRETRHRVVRGMRGQLERGFEIGPPAYGYTIQRSYNDNGGRIGSNWRVCDDEAETVRWIYKVRKGGRSFVSIARELNQRGLPPPRRRSGEKKTRGYWRASSIFGLLGNAIYRGVFVWNGSRTAATRAKKEHRPLETVEYLRPHLRLVDDDTWAACNQRGPGRHRAGRKHLLAGLATCGECGATMSVSASRPAQLYCASCYLAKRVGARGGWMGYVSMNGVVKAMEFVLEQVLTGDIIDEFRRRLSERISGGAKAKLAELQEDVARLTRAAERLARAMRETDADDDVLGREYRAARGELITAKERLTAAARGMTMAQKRALEQQVAVDPSKVLGELLKDAGKLERVQAVLRRLLPRIVMVARPRRFESVWDFTFAPGVALAEATDTEVIESGSVTVRIRVRCGAARPTRWEIERI